MRRVGISSDGKLSTALPQLPFLVQLRFVHVLPGDLRTNELDSSTRHAQDRGVYLLHLSDHLISHIGMTFREVSTSINSDASLIGGFDVQGTLRVEGVLAKRGVLEVWRSLVYAGNA